MANKHASLNALFTDIADAIREKTGDIAIIVADDFPDVIRERLQAAPPPAYLTFRSPNSFTLKVNDTTKHWNGTLEYSTDASTWSTWDGTTMLSSATSGSKNVLYLRGTGNTVITGSRTNYRWVLTGSDIACIGNIENLLDYATVESGAHPTMANNCYRSMFQGCTSLTQAPALPATTLANYCYNSMFYGCSSLTQAPALPATTLVNYCYAYMFQNCTNLTQAPALPATTLADYCYRQMFQGCTNLTQAPALPATTLVDNCYLQMFQGCTNLTQAPALPATTLADSCYESMFYGCSGLTHAPTLPATVLAVNCYYQMFYGCTSLTQAPALPATTLADSCYANMFQDCTALTHAPVLPAMTLVAYCYQYMFQGCTSLTQAPALPATTLADYCYYSMFEGCTNLTQAPALPATTLATYCYRQMFYGCSSLTQAPALPATTLADYCYISMFRDCTSLTQVPALPATTLADYCYNGMFTGCSEIKLSPTQTGAYTVAYRIPTSGTGTTATNALNNMFLSTGGTFTGTPSINTTYYLSNTNTVVVPPPIPYLTFSSPSSFTLKINDTTKHWDGTLEYSTNISTWSTWDGTTTLSSDTSGSDNVLYMRGTGNTVITGSSTNYRWVLTGTDISCIGNIENLLDYATVESGAHPTMASNCYKYMFRGCTGLTQAPTLSATTLASGCYQYMFRDCTGLIQAPALPATTLASNCYDSMFRGCTNLTTVPALPATTLVSNCYYSMFENCTSLKLSSTQTGEYTIAYRIPTTGTGTTATNATDVLSYMFTSTGGTFTGTPKINTTYYLSNTNTVV